MEPIIRLKRACELLDCTRPTINRMIARGDLPPPIKINKRFVFWTPASWKRAMKRLRNKKYQ